MSKVKDVDVDNNTTWCDKLRVRELVLKVVEEICKLENMEVFKRNFGVLLLETLNEFIRNEDALDDSTVPREAAKVQSMEREVQQPRAFMEEDLIQSMMHRNQNTAGSLIGSFELYLI